MGVLKKQVVIIGGGITGLVTAFHLAKKRIDFVILESANRVGGVIQSVRDNGFLYEEGPNTGVIGNTEVIKLFDELNDLCTLEKANQNVRKRLILKNGKWEALPSGFISALTTPLFTLKDKFRVLGEVFIKAGKNEHENLSDMVKRRLGQSFLDYAIDPFIMGVYAGDPDKLVPKYALPKLYQLEQEYGSFIMGAIRKGFSNKSHDERKVTKEVFSAKGGMSSLVYALESKIGTENIQTGISNLAVLQRDNDYEVNFADKNGHDVQMSASCVITTTGAHRLQKIVPFVGLDSLSKITSLHYTNVVQVVLGFDVWHGMDLDAFGGLIPNKEKRNILGVLFMSSLFENRAPKNGALLSVFMGGVRKPEIYHLDDKQILEIVKKEVTSLLSLNEFNPDLIRILRHKNAIPQYEASSGSRFEMIKQLEHKYPGLIIGGNIRNGIGLADRILQARDLVDKAVQHLNH